MGAGEGVYNRMKVKCIGNFGVPNSRFKDKIEPVERNEKTYPEIEHPNYVLAKGEIYEVSDEVDISKCEWFEQTGKKPVSRAQEPKTESRRD